MRIRVGRTKIVQDGADIKASVHLSARTMSQCRQTNNLNRRILAHFLWDSHKHPDVNIYEENIPFEPLPYENIRSPKPACLLSLGIECAHRM